MIHDGKNSIMGYIFGMIFMVVSASGWAEYSQKQNKVDDKDSDRLSQPRSSSDKRSNGDDHKKNSSDHHDVSTDNRSGTNPNVPSRSDKKSGY